MKKKVQTAIHQNETFSKSMDIFDQRYYRVNKRLLCLLGQWPYQSGSHRNFKFWFIIAYSCSALGPQIKALIQTWGKLDLFVACFSPLVVHIVCDIKLLNSMLHTQEIRNLLDQTRDDWERMRYLPQIKILQQHGETGRFFSISYFVMCYTIIFGWLLTPFVPILMDVYAPLNYSRPKLDIFPTDHMVDPDKYFYPILFHLGIGVLIVMLVPMAVDTLYMSLAQHVCAMFDILRYDLENILQEDEAISAVMLNPDFHEDSFYRDIVSCIKRHKILIVYIKAMESTCEWSLFFIVGFNLVALSLTGYQTVAKATPTEDVLRMGLFTIAQAVHLYCITLPGHWISDASSFFPDSAYSCRWYMMSLRARKLIILLIRASIEACTITAGKVYVMSIENFCSVLQSSVSYLTMLTAVQ